MSRPSEKCYLEGMDKTTHIEPLFQTPEQRTSGQVTYRVFIDGAWRNVEGSAEWKKLPEKELTRKIEEAYFTPK
jgi:hypothetical protein